MAAAAAAAAAGAVAAGAAAPQRPRALDAAQREPWWHSCVELQGGHSCGDWLKPSILRLNAQQRVGTPPQLLHICAQDAEGSDHFTVPSTEALRRKRVIVATCGAAAGRTFRLPA